MNIPINKRLYNTIKKEAISTFKSWPSAYGSAWLVRQYKLRGGKYKLSKQPKLKLKSKKEKNRKSSGITRWMEEKWINICLLPKIVPCGRKNAYKRNYPVCRPSKKISKQTPKLAKELSSSVIKRICSNKRKNPSKKLKKF